MDPGDQYSYDIYTQAARALLVGGHANPLAPLHPKRLLAVGESQSALYLTTYIDAIQPLYHVFDGFLVHSRAGGAVGIPGASPSGSFGGAVHIRTDIGVPVLMMITETDETFGGYYRARQPDTSLHQALGRRRRLSRRLLHRHASGAANLLAAPRSTRHQVISSLKPPSPPSIPGWSPARRRRRRHAWMSRLLMARLRCSTNSQRNGDRWHPGSVGTGADCGLFGQHTPRIGRVLRPVRVDSSLQRSAAQIPVWDQVVYLKAYTKATDEDIKAGYILPADKAQVLAFANQVQF